MRWWIAPVSYTHLGRKGGKNNKKETKVVMPPVTPKKITIGETVVLGELAKTMGKTAGEIIKKLFEMGIMATINPVSYTHLDVYKRQHSAYPYSLY